MKPERPRLSPVRGFLLTAAALLVLALSATASASAAAPVLERPISFQVQNAIRRDWPAPPTARPTRSVAT